MRLKRAFARLSFCFAASVAGISAAVDATPIHIAAEPSAGFTPPNASAPDRREPASPVIATRSVGADARILTARLDNQRNNSPFYDPFPIGSQAESGNAKESAAAGASQSNDHEPGFWSALASTLGLALFFFLRRSI